MEETSHIKVVKYCDEITSGICQLVKELFSQCMQCDTSYIYTHYTEGEVL